MKVLIFGYGSMGKRHTETAVALGHEVAVCDTRIGFCRDDVRWHASEGAGWNWAPEAVVIATPASTHARLFWECRRRGLHVYVEKPLALSYLDLMPLPTTDGEQVYPTETRHRGQVEHVGYQLRHHPLALAFHSAVLSDIGEPESARFVVACQMPTWPGKDYADALLECSHEIDAARWLGGDGEVVGAIAHGACIELLSAHARIPMVSIHINGFAKWPTRTWTVVGTRDSVIWDWDTGLVTRWDGAMMWDAGAGASLAFNEDAYRGALTAFFRDVQHGGPATGASLVDGLRALEMVDKARISSQNARNP